MNIYMASLNCLFWAKAEPSFNLILTETFLRCKASNAYNYDNLFLYLKNAMSSVSCDCSILLIILLILALYSISA